MLRKSVLPARIDLVGAVQLHAALLEEIDQDPVDDGCSQLGLDIVPDQGEAFFLEAGDPVRVARNEYGDVVDKGNARLKCAFHVEPCGLLRSHGEVIDEHFRPPFPEHRDHILLLGLGRTGNEEGALVRVVVHMGGAAVEDPSHPHLGPAPGHVTAENRGAVRLLENCLRDILAHLPLINVKGRDNLYVLGPVAPDLPMHQAGRLLMAGFPVVTYTLEQGAAAIAKAYYGDPDRLHFL